LCHDFRGLLQFSEQKSPFFKWHQGVKKQNPSDFGTPEKWQ